MPIGGVMALGHNFDSEKGFADSLARGIELIMGKLGGHYVNSSSALASQWSDVALPTPSWV
jgi:hypothetical protein